MVIQSKREEELEEENDTEEEELGNSENDNNKERKTRELCKWKRLSIREKGKNFWKHVKILSRAGKAGGKWDKAYNVRDLDTQEEIWINLDDYTVREETEDEKSEMMDIIEGEEIYYCEDKKCENVFKCK